jgi:hypothetical protein
MGKLVLCVVLGMEHRPGMQGKDSTERHPIPERQWNFTKDHLQPREVLRISIVCKDYKKQENFLWWGVGEEPENSLLRKLRVKSWVGLCQGEQSRMGIPGKEIASAKAQR